MRSIVNLFGRSPFIPLRQHMEKVVGCIHLLADFFSALLAGRHGDVETLSQKIQAYEHEADQAKNDIRNHLPKSLFLPIHREQLLEILALQDRLADRAEDIAVLCTLKEISLPESVREPFQRLLEKSLETFELVVSVVAEMHDLLESSFGGFEAEKVSAMVGKVAYAEHEVDLIQRDLLKAFYSEEDKLTLSSFYLWQKVFEAVSDISNLSEALANRVRMTLELH